MRDRLHGVLADVVVESYDPRGVLRLPGRHGSDRAGRRRQDRGIVAHDGDLWDHEDRPCPTGRGLPEPFRSWASRPEERAKTGDFAEFLVDDHDRRIPPSFQVSEELRRHSPAGELLKDLGSDDPFAKYYEEPGPGRKCPNTEP